MDVNNYNNQNDYNYVCHVCGTVFDARQGVCPNCKTPANVVIPNAEALQTQNNKSGMKTAIIIVSVVLAVLVAVGSALAVVMMNKDEYSKNTAAGKTNSKKLTEAELINACDLIDYSAYAEVFDAFIPTEYKGSMQTLIIDADKDGRQEMFVDVHSPINDFRDAVFAFEPFETAHMSKFDNTVRYNEYELKKGKDGSIYKIENGHSKGSVSEDIFKWESNDWKKIGGYREQFELETFEVIEFEGSLNNQSFSNCEQYESAVDELELTDLGGSHQHYRSNYFYTSSPKDVISAYQNRINSLNNGSRYVTGDYDGDGETEYVFVVAFDTEQWLNAIFQIEAGHEYDYSDYENYDYRREAYIYADTDEKGVVFHCITLTSVDHGYEMNVSWENSVLKIEFVVPNSEPIICEYYCDGVEDTRAQIENNGNEYVDAVNRYIKFINNKFQGILVDNDSVVGVKYADIADYPGKECILVVKGAYESYIEVCTFYCGRAIVLYRINEHDGSVYLVNVDGKEHILYYSQARFDGVGGGGSTYCYKTLRFDQNCCPSYRDYYEITIYDNSTPNESHNAFFNGFNSLLSSAKVCLDSYELTGYKYMQDSDINVSGNEQAKYLAISNCNPTKSGLVNIQDVESWLNFREGPSTQYNKILLDPADSKSFVKQAKGSAVTVIDTVNTGDEKNPIWVKIQIKYADRTLVGYSSQNYIDIPNIRHISVGESFTVTANTNDSGLTWTCNDTGVLSIDSSSGAVTGVKRGLVLVTVRSDSGLYDSCLIMVD